MNSDTSLAAWMIAGGPRTIDPSDTRNIAHLRELATWRRDGPGPSLTQRVSAAFATLRSPLRRPDIACCPA